VIKKINKKYIKYYFNNPLVFKKMSVITFVIDSLILLTFAVYGLWNLFSIVLWLWGLSIVTLVVECKRGSDKHDV
jgi:hypothetical protein